MTSAIKYAVRLVGTATFLMARIHCPIVTSVI